MKKNKPVYVLGTGLSHDGSACILKDGVVAVAIEKERLTRKKHDGINDDAAVRYCLEAEGITMKDLDLVVQCGHSPLYLKDYHLVRGFGKRLVDEDWGVPVVNLSHHLAHAYNAVGSAPFDEMAVLVVDGFGQTMQHCMDLQGTVYPSGIQEEYRHMFYEKDSFYVYRDKKLVPLFKDFSCEGDFFVDASMFPLYMKHSIGEMYERAAGYCLGTFGEPNFGMAGKLMGLAPYGKPGVYTDRIFDCNNGRVMVNYDWQKKFHQPCINYEDFKKRFQYFADIAYWVQKETEAALLYLVNERAKLSDVRNLAYTGGVALNAVANGKILANSSFEKLYMTPAAGDNGLALGCAYYGWLEVLKKERVLDNGNSCFGKIYPDEHIESAISNYRNYDIPDRKEAVALFFDAFPSCIRKAAVPAAPFDLQFVITGCGLYAAQFGNENVAVMKGGVPVPSAMIIASGKNFMDLMMDFASAPKLFSSGAVRVEGRIDLLQECFDPSAAKNLMEGIIASLFEKSGSKIDFVKETDVVDAAAKLLAEGKTLGWFQGGSEFGPRALGHRSILADPRRKDVQQFINAQVKFREDFRPFAPSVLLEDVSEYFQFEGESPYMIMVAQVQPAWKDKIPGVVHQDNSCRIQTVTPAWNKSYYSLLRRFKEITGVGVLLNTSFNRRKMPIVETPEEAIRFFFECDLDCLVMGDYIVHKKTGTDEAGR